MSARSTRGRRGAGRDAAESVPRSRARVARRSIGRSARWLALGGGIASAAAYVALRPRLVRWGATDAEVAGPMPGDALVAGADYALTFAVTIDAPPADVWPWLAQMGYQRGGLYSYDWLDRLFGFLDRPSATTVLPEFQVLRAGDRIPIGRGPSWPVASAEPERALVLEPVAGTVTWAFQLTPTTDGRTRLVTRSRGRFANGLRDALTAEVMRPAAFVMTRGMLLGIRRRAEALARRRERASADAWDEGWT